MTQLEILAVVIGILSYLTGAVWVTVLAFRKSVWWGLGCLFFPPLTLVFVIIYFPDLRIALGCKICGVLLILCGAWGLTHRDASTAAPENSPQAAKLRKRPDSASPR